MAKQSKVERLEKYVAGAQAAAERAMAQADAALVAVGQTAERIEQLVASAAEKREALELELSKLHDEVTAVASAERRLFLDAIEASKKALAAVDAAKEAALGKVDATREAALADLRAAASGIDAQARELDQPLVQLKEAVQACHAARGTVLDSTKRLEELAQKAPALVEPAPVVTVTPVEPAPVEPAPVESVDVSAPPEAPASPAR